MANDLGNLFNLLTLKEAARYLKVSPDTLKRLGEVGLLVPARINTRGDRQYKMEDIKKFINEREEEGEYNGKK